MIFALFYSITAFAGQPVTYPVFLKQGFSTVLEFENAPTRIVVGDSQSFQVERMERSLVVRALTPNASGNLFVFFAGGDPRVFLLTASDDAEPTLYRKFEELKAIATVEPKREAWTRASYGHGIVLRSTVFDSKKDFLTVNASILSDGSKSIRPDWEKVRLKYKNQSLAPAKLWAERKEVQRDANVKARFIFVKPNLPSDFGGAMLVVPLLGEAKALSVELRRK